MKPARTKRRLICAGAALGLGVCAVAAARAQGAGDAVVLDKVVAVVNNHAILESDVELEVRLTILEPGGTGNEPRTDALQRIISRTLIQQQIRAEEAKIEGPTNEEVQARLQELRRDLPKCASADCTTDAGWAALLKAHDLTEADAENYARLRLQLLAFIEERFGQGIHITQEEIESYYRATFLPQFHSGETPPKLESVRMRIEEILLQEQVNKLFGAWLDTLRKQGDVQILDPALESAQTDNSGGGGQL
jgi:peptidyl-prolyl cis-trans isomerase SurA